MAKKRSSRFAQDGARKKTACGYAVLGGSDATVAKIAQCNRAFVLRASRLRSLCRSGSRRRRWAQTRRTVPQLAHDAAVSRSAFFERCSEAVGMAPMESLPAWRMARAKLLLRQRGIAISEIAERVGYSSVGTFGVAFTRQRGHSAGPLRQAGSGGCNGPSNRGIRGQTGVRTRNTLSLRPSHAPVEELRKQARTKKPRLAGLQCGSDCRFEHRRSHTWRRGRDSNPRYVTVRLISSQVHSTTLPPLRCLSSLRF